VHSTNGQDDLAPTRTPSVWSGDALLATGRLRQARDRRCLVRRWDATAIAWWSPSPAAA